MSFANGQQFGQEYSRPHGSLPTMLACRICDKIFLSTHSLIIHYETHGDELVNQRQNHQRSNVLPYQRDRRNIRLGNNSYQHRHHPYLPNGYQERNVVGNANSPYLVPTQNQQLYQTRNQPASSWCPITGETSAAGASHFVGNQPTQVPRLHLGPTMNNQHATLRSLLLNQNLGTSSKIDSRKGYDEGGDKRTIWYLGQLERPIPSIIDKYSA